MKSRSISLRRFEANIRVVRGLAQLESRYKLPVPPRSRPKSTGLLGGACVLLCGIFENYLKEVFGEAAMDLQCRIRRYDDPKLPAKFRERNVLNYVRWIARARISNVDKIAGVESHARAIASVEINFESFDKTNSNPNSETIREMFSNVGVDDVFTKIETEYNTISSPALSAQTIIQTVDSFIRIRNEYAHLGNTSAHTRNDLAANIQFIRNLAAGIDRVLVHHVNQI